MGQYAGDFPTTHALLIGTVEYGYLTESTCVKLLSEFCTRNF